MSAVDDVSISVDKGEVVEQGTHEELMEKRGEYHAMVLRSPSSNDVFDAKPNLFFALSTSRFTILSTSFLQACLGESPLRTNGRSTGTRSLVPCSRKSLGSLMPGAYLSGQDDPALFPRLDPLGDLLVDAGHHPVEVGARGLEPLVGGARLHHAGHALELLAVALGGLLALLELAGITYVPLFTYEAMLAVANQHRLAGKPYIVPEDLVSETLITYPVERDRLDIFTRFLEPADIEPAQVRTSELTVMMMQLVASGRGVCGMPHWALHEYSSRGYVKAKRLGEKGLFATLYAAVRGADLAELGGDELVGLEDGARLAVEALLLDREDLVLEAALVACPGGALVALDGRGVDVVPGVGQVDPDQGRPGA